MSIVQEATKAIRGKNIRIVYPEGTDARILRAAVRHAKDGILHPILLGTREEVEKLAEEEGVSLEGVDFIDYQHYELFHPVYTWKRTVLDNFVAREMKERIFSDGKLVYALPSLKERRDYCAAELDTLWEEYKRFDHPHEYKVDLSLAVWDVKHDLLARTQQRIRP